MTVGSRTKFNFTQRAVAVPAYIRVDTFFVGTNFVSWHSSMKMQNLKKISRYTCSNYTSLTSNHFVHERVIIQNDIHSIAVPEEDSVRLAISPVLQIERVGAILCIEEGREGGTEERRKGGGEGRREGRRAA